MFLIIKNLRINLVTLLINYQCQWIFNLMSYRDIFLSNNQHALTKLSNNSNNLIVIKV